MIGSGHYRQGSTTLVKKDHSTPTFLVVDHVNAGGWTIKGLYLLYDDRVGGGAPQLGGHAVYRLQQVP